MTAMKQGVNFGYKFLLGTGTNLEFDDSLVCSRISANFLGSSYYIYNHGFKQKKDMPENQIRNELAVVQYVSVLFNL